MLSKHSKSFVILNTPQAFFLFMNSFAAAANQKLSKFTVPINRITSSIDLIREDKIDRLNSKRVTFKIALLKK